MPRHLLSLPQTAASCKPCTPAARTPQNVLDRSLMSSASLPMPAPESRIVTGLSDTSEELSGKTIAPRLFLNNFIRDGSPSGVYL
eukprot:scaffold5491_cov117-Isochrysis_galbana.AAC.12